MTASWRGDGTEAHSVRRCRRRAAYIRLHLSQNQRFLLSSRKQLQNQIETQNTQSCTDTIVVSVIPDKICFASVTMRLTPEELAQASIPLPEVVEVS